MNSVQNSHQFQKPTEKSVTVVFRLVAQQLIGFVKNRVTSQVQGLIDMGNDTVVLQPPDQLIDTAVIKALNSRNARAALESRLGGDGIHREITRRNGSKEETRQYYIKATRKPPGSPAQILPASSSSCPTKILKRGSSDVCALWSAIEKNHNRRENEYMIAWTGSKVKIKGCGVMSRYQQTDCWPTK